MPVKAGRRLRDRVPPTHAVLGWEAFDSFAAVTNWNLLLVDLEEKKWPKRAANLKNYAGVIK